VTLVVGNAPQIGKTLFDQGYTLAAVIASEFGEADELHTGALIACGLLLFVITLVINGIARTLVMRAETKRFRDNQIVITTDDLDGRRIPGGV
jgi:phosphate transport system permease protein